MNIEFKIGDNIKINKKNYFCDNCDKIEKCNNILTLKRIYDWQLYSFTECVLSGRFDNTFFDLRYNKIERLKKLL
jgi:hypothetical protein